MIGVIVALSVALGGLKVWSDRRLRRFANAFPPVGEFLTVEGTRLHYLSKGAGTSVVLIHGSDGVLQEFVLSILDRVAQAHRAVAFDRPGHGYSGRPEGEPLTLSLNARLLHGALLQLGMRKPVLIGHSYGGSVALQYALDYPDDVAALVLLAPAAYAQRSFGCPLFSLPEVPLLGPLLMRTVLVPVGHLVAAAVTGRAFAPDPVPEQYRKAMEAYSLRPDQFRAFAEEIRRLTEGLDAMRSRYDQIRLPVTIVAGDADRVTELAKHGRTLHRAIPQSTLVVFSGTGHQVHHKHAEAILDAVQDVVGRAGIEMP